MPEPYRFYSTDLDSLIRRGHDGLDTPQGWDGSAWKWTGGYAPTDLYEVTEEEAARLEPEADLAAADPAPGDKLGGGEDSGEEEAEEAPADEEG